MKRIALALSLAVAAAASSAQYLRAGATALVTDPVGYQADSRETDWTDFVNGAPVTEFTTLTRSAGAHTMLSDATASFTAGIGSLKAYTRASSNYGGGSVGSQASGTFSNFSSFIGAGFNDRITVSGDGAIVVDIHYVLHSVQSSGGTGTSTYAALDVVSYGAPISGIAGGGAIEFHGDGNRLAERSYTLTMHNGETFFVNAELAAYSILTLSSGSSGFHFADTDAMHTGTISISATGGSFVSASGYSYAAAVPEPGTASMGALGIGVLLWWMQPSRRHRRQG